jgi:hypothetical protein
VLTQPNVPIDLVLDIGSQFVSALWVLTVQAFVDAVGSEKATSILRPLMTKSGLAAGLRFSQMLYTDEEEKKTLQKMLAFLNELLQQSAEIRTTENGIDELVKDCPFQDAPREICALFDAFAEGMCRSIDPECQLAVTRLEEGKEASCHWKIEIKNDGGS